ncbi:DUF1810 domain-containing protein [Mucilaginibacter sp. CSA2-8R]|uniref:DUF1810 domain-containing protein n=1 Tax=Mucilaginibacter sp. CSA2-8R TaxID=3141542 RepID=UPI00315D0878
MTQENSLDRFIKAQQNDYATALSEIKKGKKRSHWMWYIFPQLRGLGMSETARFYGIQDKQEAMDYLNTQVLSKRLIEICEALLALPGNDPHYIFGSPDDMKLKSSMTLFASLPNANPVFEQVLSKYYDGDRDQKTLQLINHK